MAVNLRPTRLLEPDVVGLVTRTLAEHRLDAHRLVLEITESELVRHDAALPALVALRALGVRVSLDHFGTGYSSLAYVTRLPVDELKVDQSFVRLLPHDPAARAVVQATVTMAGALGLEVVAEGVEQPEQAAALRELGCDLLQGFLLGRPAPGAGAPRSLSPAVPPARPATGRPAQAAGPAGG